MANNDIIKIIKNKIALNKFIDIEEFLKLSLYENKNGFYKKLDNSNFELIGSKGHFITSPEISQMFGELIAIWIIDFCIKLNTSIINLVELGPGKGTLMNDILRVINSQKFKQIKINLFFLETSKKLSQIQSKQINDFNFKKSWYKDFSKLKINLINYPVIFIANEFFDCLPIQQYTLNENSNLWEKVCLKLKGNQLYFDQVQVTKYENIMINKIKSFHKTNNKKNSFIEYSPMTSEIISQISEIIKSFDGCALLIDYGKNNPYGNTIQAVFKNKRVSLLDKIGNCDYSSLVDFSNMDKIAKDKGLFVYPTVSQREFLLKLGIKQRAENLSNNASPLQKRYILSCLDRLISKKQMGEIFKVFCMTKSKLNLLGFNN